MLQCEEYGITEPNPRQQPAKSKHALTLLYEN